jgi:hypothetical protein
MIGFIQIESTVFNIARIDHIDDANNAAGCTLVIDTLRFQVTETRDQVIAKIHQAESGQVVPILTPRPKP